MYNVRMAALVCLTIPGYVLTAQGADDTGSVGRLAVSIKLDRGTGQGINCADIQPAAEARGVQPILPGRSWPLYQGPLLREERRSISSLLHSWHP